MIGRGRNIARARRRLPGLGRPAAPDPEARRSARPGASAADAGAPVVLDAPAGPGGHSDAVVGLGA